MRLGFDLRIHRYPPGGTTTYADVMRERLALARPETEVVPLPGWPRLARGGKTPAAVRRGTNLAVDAGWLAWGGAATAVRQRLDAWFSPSWPMPPMLPVPSVVAVQNVDFLDAPEAFPPAYVAAAEALVRLSTGPAARVVAPSVHVRDRLIERMHLAPERVVVTSLGLDHLPAPATHAVHPRPYALSIGQTEPLWNLEVLVDAWSAGAGGDLDLVICAVPGRLEGSLRERVGRAGLVDRVHLLGHLPPPRLMAAIRDAELFVYPVLADGTGKPPLEAMLLGVPCAVADRGGMRELTEGAALLFDPEDLDALVDAVRRLRDDRELADRLREDGRRVAGRHTWAAATQVLWRALDEATAG